MDVDDLYKVTGLWCHKLREGCRRIWKSKTPLFLGSSLKEGKGVVTRDERVSKCDDYFQKRPKDGDRKSTRG